MGGNSVIGALFKSVGFYSKSFLFFAVLAVVGYGLILFQPLSADEPIEDRATYQGDFDLAIAMQEDGSFYLGNEKLPVTVVTGETSYRYRYQVIDQPTENLEQLIVLVELPKPLPEGSIAHRFINNGGAVSAESTQVDPQTLIFQAEDIGTQAQLTFEIEVPKSYISNTAFTQLQQQLLDLPSYVWMATSIGLPLLTLLVLLVIALARSRKVPTSHLGTIEDPPSRLAPAMLGILMRGRLTSRDIAATLIDLARRGHLVIHQVSINDFRFSRKDSADRLENFERMMLDQIFGPASEHATGQEISFALAQELFSKRISQAFMLAYQKVNDLGYFYTNPLTLHRRYQTVGVLFFLLAVVGFFLNIFILSQYKFSILLWIGMMVSALVIYNSSKNLPTRTVLGDRELAKWLVFGQHLSGSEPVGFMAHNQERYLAYLPYAIVMESEVEWTRRFYDLPFAQPTWYIAARITTIDEFANKVFPLFGYLSHTLALSTQPASR